MKSFKDFITERKNHTSVSDYSEFEKMVKDRWSDDNHEIKFKKDFPSKGMVQALSGNMVVGSFDKEYGSGEVKQK